MRALDRTQTGSIDLADRREEDNQLQHMQQRRSARRLSAEPSDASKAPCSLDDALLALAAAERQLSGALRNNASLKANNERLMQALDGAARMAVAAQRVAHHDALTGLPNRLLLIKRLQLAIRNAAQQPHQLALLFVDLDGFKAVNDRFGHTVGDKLLTIVAARIAACVRASDLACRYGGDEFVVLLTGLEDAGIAFSTVEHIREHVGQRYTVDDNEIQITASIGAAVYPADGESYDVLLSRADASMFRDKAARRARFPFCETPESAGAGHREESTTAC